MRRLISVTRHSNLHLVKTSQMEIGHILVKYRSDKNIDFVIVTSSRATH